MNSLLIAALAALGALAPTDSLKTERIDSVVVSSGWAYYETPVTETTVWSLGLAGSNPINSLPMTLSLQPSVVTTNEGGTGLGYSKMTVRGSKGSQINVTLNGITLNDSESQEVFWVNLPSLSRILHSAQLQRGLGTSVSGPGAFGASLNLEEDKWDLGRSAFIDFSYGSFNTSMTTVSFDTGTSNKGFRGYGAYSKGITDGYIRNAFGDVQSAFAKLSWEGRNDDVSLTWLMGDQHTGITWNGISAVDLAVDRTYNSAGQYKDSEGNICYYPNETDNYTQHHLQLKYHHRWGLKLHWTSVLNWTNGKGYYDQYKTGKKFKAYGFGAADVADPSAKSDFIINKSMSNDYFVVKSDLRYFGNRSVLSGGVYLSAFDGLHYGDVKWNKELGEVSSHQWYLNEGLKKEANVWARAEYTPIPALNAYVDLQYRGILYGLSGIDDEFSDMTWNGGWGFFNPRAGLTWAPKRGHKAYAFVALGHREPGRSDIKEIIETNNAAGTSLEIKPEKMIDTEIGYEYWNGYVSASANIYLMEYKDMLLETGKLTDSGYAIKENVPRSWRRGIELAAAWNPSINITLEGNATFSVNQIKDYTAYYEEYDNIDDWNFVGQYQQHFDKTTMLMSPSVVAMTRFIWWTSMGLKLSADLKYVGKQYWDNTASEDRCLPAYMVANASLSDYFDIDLGPRHSFRLTLGLYFGNLFNRMYEADAWVYRAHFRGGSTEWYQEEGLFPQAPFNCMFRVGLQF
ncbi:MAG: TonB-dependent receptor [Bacteroidales bacterium]|nr:TonB-dependent receptor [Bacteroidales bacterium]